MSRIAVKLGVLATAPRLPATLLLAAAFALLAARPSAASDSREKAQGRPAAQEPPISESYRIGPEDLLQISVWKNEAMSVTVPVRPDGMISLPLLHDVPAAGLTPLQLRDLLVRRLADYVQDPEVSVIVREVHSFKVSVVGEVAHPGRFTVFESGQVRPLALSPDNHLFAVNTPDNRLEICAGVASCLGSHVFKVNLRGQRHVCSVDLKNLQPCCDIRRWHKDQPIESSRAQDSRIDDIWSVGRADYYNVL